MTIQEKRDSLHHVALIVECANYKHARMLL